MSLDVLYVHREKGVLQVNITYGVGSVNEWIPAKGTVPQHAVLLIFYSLRTHVDPTLVTNLYHPPFSVFYHPSRDRNSHRLQSSNRIQKRYICLSRPRTPTLTFIKQHCSRNSIVISTFCETNYRNK
jgi:hypothetical protein